MTSASHTAYRALRDYLNALIASTLPDQPLDDVPAALRPELEIFMQGKARYHDESGRHMIPATDLAEWATNLVHGTGLTTPLPLATLDVAALQTAILRQTAQ
jgi:hypothetical protein